MSTGELSDYWWYVRHQDRRGHLCCHHRQLGRQVILTGAASYKLLV